MKPLPVETEIYTGKMKDGYASILFIVALGYYIGSQMSNANWVIKLLMAIISSQAIARKRRFSNWSDEMLRAYISASCFTENMHLSPPHNLKWCCAERAASPLFCWSLISSVLWVWLLNWPWPKTKTELRITMTGVHVARLWISILAVSKREQREVASVGEEKNWLRLVLKCTPIIPKCQCAWKTPPYRLLESYHPWCGRQLLGQSLKNPH